MAENPLNLALRFGLEIAALVAYGLWGWSASTGPLRFVLAAGVPLLVAVLWGAFVSPRASVPAPGVAVLAIELAIFGGAVAALYISGRPTAAIVLGVLVALHELLSYDRIAMMIRR